uniref:Uncharacterized protein n=1 Tax=Laticauda laticaudata TaxID=8630 RepID=A0A8C5SA56_LATLA
MTEDPMSGSWKPTTLSENASNNVIPMHAATQDVLDSGVNSGIVQTKETAPLNRCEEHAQGPLAQFKTSGRQICVCPPQGILAKIATNVIAVALIWAVIWSITTHESLPGGSLFGFLFLYLFAVIGGKIMGLIKFPGLPPLPPLLGMLLVGFLLRNIPVITDIVLINVKWGATLRSIALAIILARAGLGLDPKALKKLKAVCFRLSLGPCLIEACTAAVISHFLMHLPWQWGFMLG